MFSTRNKGKHKKTSSSNKSRSKSSKRRKTDHTSSEDDDEDWRDDYYPSEDEDEEQPQDEDVDDDSPMPVGGVTARNMMSQTDDIKTHPRWVKLPAADLESQRMEIRNHINVSIFYILIFKQGLS